MCLAWSLWSVAHITAPSLNSLVPDSLWSKKAGTTISDETSPAASCHVGHLERSWPPWPMLL